MSLVYVYEEMPADLETNGHALFDWADLPEINRILNGDYTFYGNYSLDGQNVEYLKEDNFIRAEDEDGKMKYFEIKKVTKNLNSFSIMGRAIGYMLSRNFIENSFTSAGNGSIIMSRLKAALAFEQPFSFESTIQTVHQFTVKQTNPIDAIIGSNNGNENLSNVTDGELDMENYRLKLLDRIGKDNGYRIDLGVNLEAIEEEIDGNYYNSLYLVGGVPEGDYDEDKEPITFKFLELKGVTDKNRRIGKYENSEITTVEELKKWGQTKFDNDRVHEPSVTHTVSMVQLEHTLEYEGLYRDIARLHFGDTCYCKVAKLSIEVAERMVEYTWYPTLGKYKSITLGNDIEFYTNTTATEAAKLRQKVETRTELLVEAVRNASSWITGTKGGYVRFRPEKAPSEILIMDKPSVADAQKVWRWNLGGLGYSKNGVDGPYELAITQDGAIVADFITAGILSGILVQGVAIKTLDDDDFQVVMEGGVIAFEKQVNSTGLDDVHGEKLGKIVATYGGNKNINGFAVVQAPNYIFSINTGDQNNPKYSKAIFQIPKESNAANPLYKLIGSGTFKEGKITFEDSVEFNSRIDAKEIYINGQKVVAGQGGGPSTGGGTGTGGYPPELTTDAEKFAWDWWSFALNNSYSEEAAAGVLGNIQGEVGPSMNPNTTQVGGPAYGWVQWDGSAYPLIGAPTYDGREYVQRLMAASGIKEVYTTSLAQAKLIEWCMYNGQWIGKVSPTTVAEFKAITNVEQAATAFELNFERPATAHPERQGYARYWYNKLHGLKASQLVGEEGLKHLNSLIGRRIGNGQCYATAAEYSGYLGGCGLGAGTKYGLTHVIGNTSAASDIGIAYDWSAVGWQVILNPTYEQLKVGAIINITRGAYWGGWYTDTTYGHTGVIRGLDNGRIQTYEQNTEKGQIVERFVREYRGRSQISSIVIPPK